MSATSSIGASVCHFENLVAKECLESKENGREVSPVVKNTSNPVPWRRALYYQQPFSDNYVPPIFLRDMKMNENVRYYHYWQIVRNTGVIVQQLSLLVVFATVFQHLIVGTISADLLVIINVIFISLWMLWLLLTYGKAAVHLYEQLRVLTVFTVVLLYLSPVIHTLTLTYSGDTIWALSLLFLVVHMICFDYSAVGVDTENRHPRTTMMAVSTNSAVFAAVVMASRLPTFAHTFSFLGFSMILFAMTPTMRRVLHQTSREGFIGVSYLLCGLSLGFLLDIRPALAAIYFAVVMGITFLLPQCLMLMQGLKAQINGPWDEAVPRNSASAEEFRNVGFFD